MQAATMFGSARRAASVSSAGFWVVEIECRRAVITDDFRQGGHVADHFLAEGEQLISDKGCAGQQQSDATGQHDDPCCLRWMDAAENFSSMILLPGGAFDAVGDAQKL